MRSRVAGLIVLGWLAAGLAPAPPGPRTRRSRSIWTRSGPPRRLGLDVHLNYVPDGRTAPDYPGEQASGGRRGSPRNGASAQSHPRARRLPAADRRSSATAGFEAGGVRGGSSGSRPDADGQDWFWGLNFEIGRVNHALDINPWNAELKGISAPARAPGRWPPTSTSTGWCTAPIRAQRPNCNWR